MGEIQTKIEKVTVYPHRARVTRRGSVAVDEGTHTLIIPKLPLGLEPESVRASARGTAKAQLVAVHVERTIYRESPAAQVQDLAQQIEQLSDEDTSLASQDSVLEQELTHLEALAGQTETFARGIAFGRTTVSDQAALLDYVRQAKTDLLMERHAVALKRRELKKTLAKLRQELERLQGARPRQRHRAQIELEVSKAGQVEIDLIYTLGRASWRPLYDLRLWDSTADAQEPRLEATYLGQVQQDTGEDWQDVELTLSTARPAESTKLPELDPWYLNVFTPPPPRMERMAMKRAAAPMPSAMAADAKVDRALPPEAEPFEPIQDTQAVIDTSGAVVTFRVGGRADIPSDNSPHKTTIATFGLTPELDYLCAPILTDTVNRRAIVTNSSPAVFLPGAANIFAGDEFIGRTDLALIAPNETFELALGADDRVKVKRELVLREVDKALIGDKRRLRFGYQIEVENLRPAAETIIIRDHFPLSRHEQIKVKLELAEPTPATTEKSELHLLEWTLTVPAGEKQHIRFFYQIEHPRSLQIVGLPD